MNFENIKLKNVVWVGHYRPKMKKWPAVNRQTHIIGVGISGLSYNYIDGQNFKVEENCIYFLNVKDDYFVEVPNLEITESYSTHFTTYEPIDTPSFMIKVKNSSEIVKLLDKICAQYFSNTINTNSGFSHFYELLDYVQNLRKKNYSPSDKRMITAIEYLDANFADKNCIEIAQNACGISRRRFNELFKKQFDVTPNRYVITRKIGYAKQLLFSSPLSVSEISEVCGFNDICYFSNVFKSETGYSPCKYRTIEPK